MATCERETALTTIELPREFEEMTGLVRSDLKAVVTMLADRANDRLMLTRRQHRRLKLDLWNGLVASVNKTLAPLSAENR